jgi:uncharacterized membrane protein YvlD (DUF360 family)
MIGILQGLFLSSLLLFLLPYVLPDVKIDRFAAAGKLFLLILVVNGFALIIIGSFILPIFGWFLPFKRLILFFCRWVITSLALDLGSDFIEGVSIGSFKSAWLAGLILSAAGLLW